MPFDFPSYLLGKQSGGGGGGGSSPWTKLAEKDFTVSTSSTSETEVGTISIAEIGEIAFAKNKMVWVQVRDKAGKQSGYFYGVDEIIHGSTKTVISYRDKAGTLNEATGSYGVYADTPNNSTSNILSIRSRYNSTFSLTIDGTYHVEVYTLEWPDNVSPFA